MKYAGAWRRLSAFLIDALALILFYSLAGGLFGVSPLLESLFLDLSCVGLWWLAGLSIANWLYFALFESSPWQATPGKKCLHLQVIHLSGERIGFGRASARHFAKTLSRLLAFLGFILILFTKKKQALHDKIASTLIIQRP